ncbi:hypothetical protein H8959_002434 [Pygathrix nigripes]
MCMNTRRAQGRDQRKTASLCLLLVASFSYSHDSHRLTVGENKQSRWIGPCPQAPRLPRLPPALLLCSQVSLGESRHLSRHLSCYLQKSGEGGGHSLQCYSCSNPTTDCKTAINCSSGFDVCLIARAGLQVYNQCWKFADCNFNDISTHLKESELKYHCCKKDLCNFNEQLESGGTSLSEKTVLLLVTPLLAAAWHLHP